MEARKLWAALVAAAALLALGAGRPLYSARSQHFIVSAPTPQLAKEVCQAAEKFRRDLAIEWLGRELPPWRDICPITVRLDPGAGGATSFVFQGGMPTQWTMQIQGTRERILDSVLPHEITHTIFATHFGRPLPRWADEGGSTTVEHVSEKAKQDRLLIQHLKSEPSRGIPFNDMFRMTDYPRDILPLYSQGYSLARFFIQQGGKRKFVEYVGEGMRTNNWTATTRKYYGFGSLSDLQIAWVDWVRQGSPALADASSVASAAPPTGDRSGNVAMTQMATLLQQPQSRIPDGALSSWQTLQAQNARAFARADQAETPPRREPSEAVPASSPAPNTLSSVARPVSDGWYAKQRDQAQAALQSQPQAPPPSPASPGSQALPGNPLPRGSASPASREDDKRRVLMEWTRGQAAQ
jgi:hypothetical protein